MTRPMITVGIAFLAATFVASFFVGVWVAAGYAVILLLLVVLLLQKKKNFRVASVAIVIAMLLGVTGYWAKYRFEYLPILKLDNQTVTVTGVITNQYQNEKGTAVYEMRVKDVEGHKIPSFHSNIYSITPFQAENYDTVQMQVEFHKITSTTSFDAKAVNQTKELYVIGYAKGEPFQITSPKVRPPSFYLQKLNGNLCDRVDKYLQPPTSGMVKAMLLGQQNDIEPLLQRSLSRAGIIHIISISGMHITFLAGFLFVLLKLFRIPNWLNSLIGIVVIWLFVALVNFQIATVRSAIMVTVLLAGNLFGRPVDLVNSLFLSGTMIVIVNPFSIQNISFQLTFLATLGVLLCVKPIKNWVQSKWRIQNTILLSLIESIACTIGATLFILPVLAFTFGGISLVSPIANIIAVPLTPLIMLGSIALLISSCIPFLAPVTYFIGNVIAFLNRVLIQSADILQKPSYAYVGMNYRLVKLWLIISAIGIAVFLLFCWVTNRKDFKIAIYRFIGCSLCCFIGILLNCSMQESQDLKVTTIGSYETQAIVVTYQKKATVITYVTDGYIHKSVVNYLDSKNVNQVESLILLQDNTKKIEDIAYLMKTKKVSTVMINEQNQLIDYFQLNNPQKSNLLLLNRNYRVKANELMWFDVVSQDKEQSVLLNMGKRRIGITNSGKFAQNNPAEILYFSQKNITRIEQFSSKYVILIDRCKKSAKVSKKQCFDAYENSLELTVNKNGTYKIRK
ncbi:ComEC/Rec2 family competence protein [Paludicola sp. MB14-C6]|uniref:ComEC/Rec2 family competence protein n=1 Tax=Paludihabitans sp. MB14-C6 TaxID=3070656 RepID=UPI0027DD5AE2|nr:ComEC/Rec2 family competence protein [Paludicola sp. MB14-C6]WMJ21982.1 ComEC/Rec2 family competence protein [Paludicola sp. MB14-C6]